MSDAQPPMPPKAKRDRSPSFPFIPLKTAIERLEALDGHFGRHPTPADHVGAAWGLKGQSSQADQTLAALRSFGLIQYEGIGPKRVVTISDEGRRYLRAQQESVKEAIRKEAALRPKIIRQFWATWGADRPVDAVALDTLVLQNAFSDNGARSFLKVYDETVGYAGLSDSDKMAPTEDGKDASEENDNPPPPPAVKIGDYVQWISNGVAQFKQPRRVVGIFPDGAHVQVFGSNTGILMSELTGVEAPAPPPPGGAAPHVDAASAGSLGENEFNVLQMGGRLQITADVDLEGLQELKAMLGDYESILKRLDARRREGGLRAKLKSLADNADLDDEPR